MPSFYPEGNVVQAKDNELRTLHKIASLLVGIGSMGAGSGLIIRDGPTTPEPNPTNVNSVWLLTFRNGSAGLIWDPIAGAWF